MMKLKKNIALKIIKKKQIIIKRKLTKHDGKTN
jgi:hypothetical protein